MVTEDPKGDFIGLFLKTSCTTPSENFSIYFVLTINIIVFRETEKKPIDSIFAKAKNAKILSLFIITKNLSTGCVYKNVYCFIFLFPNNPQNLRPGHTLVFKEKDLTGLVSTPLFGFSVTTYFSLNLAIKCF